MIINIIIISSSSTITITIITISAALIFNTGTSPIKLCPPGRDADFEAERRLEHIYQIAIPSNHNNNE